MEVLGVIFIIIISMLSTYLIWINFGKKKVLDSIESSCGTGSMAEGYLKMIGFNLVVFFLSIILFSILIFGIL